MTLIAHYNAFGTPTLLGDLLVSSKEKPATEVHIPASRNINERIFRPNFYIAGLAQKIVLFNNRLAIAWAGNFDRAADFVSSLQPFRNVEKVDPDYIKDMLNAVAQEDKGRLSWLVLVSDGSGSRLFTRGVTRPRQYGNVSEVVCGGTGTARFQLMFSQLCRNVRPIAPGHATDDGFTASVISAALGEEIDRPLHLLEG